MYPLEEQLCTAYEYEGCSPEDALAMSMIAWGLTLQYHILLLFKIEFSVSTSASAGLAADKIAWALVPWKANALMPAGTADVL